MTTVKTSWQKKVLPSLTDKEHYPYLLGITSDTLAVFTKDEQLVEWVVIGKDNDGLLISLQDEDGFLEAITEISRLIKSGVNPLEFFNLSESL